MVLYRSKPSFLNFATESQAAKERKEEKFTALLHHVTIALLRQSFYALKRKAAPGVDGITWRETEGIHSFAANADPKSRFIHKSLAPELYALRIGTASPVWQELGRDRLVSTGIV